VVPFFWNESKAPREEYDIAHLDFALGFLFLPLPQPDFPCSGRDFEFPLLGVGGETTSPGKYGSHMVWQIEKGKSSPNATRQVEGGVDGS
jgi:hypothetical protein